MNQPQSNQPHRPYDVDVIQLSDFRLPGGTTSSVAEEVRAQSAAGITTAMVHVAGSVTNYPNPWSAHIRKVIGLPHVRLATVQTRLHAKVLIIRHPTVLQSTRMPLNAISADHVVIVANHAAVDAAGTWHYDVAAADARARETFGVEPIWAPIGPVVRGAIKKQKSGVPLRKEDWLNIFELKGTPEPRTGWVGQKPVIGRHSRPQLGKWPDRGSEILAAYPEDGAYDVSILGGAQVAEKLLGYVPENWEVIPFGGEDPNHFLKRIDFWVYMHHPDLKEAFGRAAMEALAAGCVAIMPPYLKELFGDAALYAKPTGVRVLLDEYSADTEKFLAQSRRAQEFAAKFSPTMHINRLEELGVTSSAQVVGSGQTDESQQTDEARQAGTSAPTERTDYDAERRLSAQRVLLITDTEPQVIQHLPQSMLDFGGTEPAGQDSVLAPGGQTNQPDNAGRDGEASEASVSTAWVMIGDAPVSSPVPRSAIYLPSAARMNMPEHDGAIWLAARLQRVTEQVAPDAVIYCGEAPPVGLLEYLKGAAAQKIWLQVSNSDPDAPVSEQAVAAVGSFHRVVPADSEEGRALMAQRGVNQ